MKISIASDHAAFSLKQEIVNYLLEKKYEILDLGVKNNQRADYPDYAKKIADSIINKHSDLGILMCGTGIGMSIAVNKIKGIRGALCLYPEMAKYARLHNNANVLVLGGRLIGIDLAKSIIDTFLKTPFEGGRHIVRIEKINNLEV